MKNKKQTSEIQKPKEKPKLCTKYQTIYMSLGMSLGIALGLSLGYLFYKESPTLGMCIGIGPGMCLGLAVGSAKDKKINEQVLIILDIIEDDFGCEEVEEPMVTIIVTDKENQQKSIRMPDALALERKLEKGDAVLLKDNGTLSPIAEG